MRLFEAFGIDGPPAGRGDGPVDIPRYYLLAALKIAIYLHLQLHSKMIKKENLAGAARALKEYLAPVDPDEFEAETGISGGDFREIVPRDSGGRIFAIDGSNVVVFDLGAVSLHRIRAGYVVYRGTGWEKTAVTYDDLFVADRENYSHHFNRYRKGIFDIEEPFELQSKEELDRMATFYRDLQEHVALFEAVLEAEAGDVVLYDGGFSLWREPYHREVFDRIFERAGERGVDLLAISKSSQLSWGRGIARPLLRSVDRLGCAALPGSPWLVRLSGRRAMREEPWGGETFAARLHPASTHAFRVDAPGRAAESIEEILGRIAFYSRSSESPGYPHALFRAHQEMKIPVQERDFTRLSLFEELRGLGFSEGEIRGALDYHEILDSIKRR